MESFWQHSLACGIGARFIAMERRLPKADKFFVAGLLHDVGRLVLFAEAPQSAQQIFDLYQREHLLLRDAEVRVLGFDHQQIGEALLNHWKYPANLVQAVAYHHQPMAANTSREEAAVVHLSDHLVNAMQIGSSGERHVPPLNLKAWEILRLQPDVLSSIIAGIDDQVEAVRGVFIKR
jgi:HD-like signal output (HDOD) protein